ncbi:helix-turn-helix domain-containing protein [Flavobacterium quisquiliarum]|uniref:Helix-turn-helix domain-containing protein n=1 Tax=Flavobacterium quisquiliarum TaxID=1834436 RepID=A0ABV8WAS0_9FLAO|nr:helix-turn-helix transcriptional regulator [Flavobacterium quisquiliarum]MBW1656304.1 helix-turn-helix domain-containing protein [Flavobacterium quisquiliarum]NWL04030.1 AraC family transcriptional regulator [Flavobacterium collinsii]
MDKLDLLQGIARISVFVSLLLAFFLLTVKTENKLANRLFAFFFISSAIDLSGFFMYLYTEDHRNLEIFRSTFCLLGMPLFYLYVLAVCYSDFRLKWKHLLHALPFVVVNLIFIPRIYMRINDGSFMGVLNQMSEIYFIQVLIEFQYAFYILSVFLILKKYKEIYLENYTNASIATYKWLFQMTCVFLVAHSIVALKNIIRYSGFRDIFLWANILVGSIALFVTCWFIMKALNHPELFRGVNSKLKLTKEILPDVEEKSESVIVQNDLINTQIVSLKKYMSEKEPFLDPSLTIQELGNQINIPVRDLSILINHHMKQHFFDFVNEYRIQKAMSILKDPSKNEFTVLEILYEVGFNSKSSFNTSFKKYTNLTPTAYRNAS